MYATREVYHRARIWILSLALLLGGFGAMRVKAQAGRGAILGTVSDASGGVIAGAWVDVKNTGTGATESTATDAQGP